MDSENVEPEQVNGKIASLISEGNIQGMIVMYRTNDNETGYYRSKMNDAEIIGLCEIIKKILLDELGDVDYNGE